MSFSGELILFRKPTPIPEELREKLEALYAPKDGSQPRGLPPIPESSNYAAYIDVKGFRSRPTSKVKLTLPPTPLAEDPNAVRRILGRDRSLDKPLTSEDK